MPRTEWGWAITPDELASWVLVNDRDLLVVNKPALVVCHPSKQGPWSSLVGACREWLGLERLHMPSRLDRETSGVVVLAKNRETASRLQKAIERRRVRKTYSAILCGRLEAAVTVDRPVARDVNASVWLKQCVVEAPHGQAAETEFVPVAAGGGYTLARVHPRTGRLHQIRVHAAWLGHPVAGDKLYGPDERLFLEFIERGFSERLRQTLPLERHALHAEEIVFDTIRGEETFRAPMTEDLRVFCQEKFGPLS